MNILPTDLFAALSHPTRLRCMMLLMRTGEMCVCELMQVTGESQANVSRHLARLRAAGLVTDRREGLWIHYRVVEQLPRWVVAVLQQTAEYGVAGLEPYVGDVVLARQADGSLC